MPCPVEDKFNPYLTNGFSHHYHWGLSTFVIRDIRSDSHFEFLFHLKNKNSTQTEKKLDGTPRSAASHLGLNCLPMSHEKDARIK